MGYSVQRTASVVVATVPTMSAAELIKATLSAHGLTATITPTFPAYPSVDFVASIEVSVSASDEETAALLLDA